MTTITIERALLEQALEALELVTEDYDDSAVGLEIEAIQALRAALAAPATAPDEQLRKDAERKPMTDAQAYAIAGAVFPYSQHAKCLELIRDAEAFHGIKGTPATEPEKCGHCGRRTIDPPWPVRTAPTTDDRHALQAAGTHPAPCARYCEAKAFELEIRGRKADTVRAEQALLAQDITLQNMAERHAQELCAYSVTVDKLRAEIDRLQAQLVRQQASYEAEIKAEIDAALERAAEVCETILDELSFANAYECANECAEAIRALKESSE